MKKSISLIMNLNALQLTFIAVQDQLRIEKEGEIISDNAAKNVADLESTLEQLKRRIENFNRKKKENE
ncbi:MAG: hypothetical protein CL525_16165 [Aequorivita sp.]|nr:hypothetical protein [Aequorivita sp.]|tara:strand:+ start:58 stop:261 length:204 start_codon:yes stop_codon:yes gene_type:complete